VVQLQMREMEVFVNKTANQFGLTSQSIHFMLCHTRITYYNNNNNKETFLFL